MRNSSKNKKSRGLFWWIGILISTCMMVGGILCFLQYFKESKDARDLYTEIAEIHDKYSNIVENTEVIIGSSLTEKDFLDECKELYEINDDIVGWICFPETTINYPVMQTSLSNRDYYLYRDFYKRSNKYGCIYAAEDCDVFEPSDNVTLYGHHMGDGSMFAGLDAYKDKEYWEGHQTFTFDTLYEHHIYQIISVFKISADDDSFRYHMFTDALDEEEFNEFIANIKSRQFYETEIPVEYGDKIVCLSTCEYTLYNGRFVVVGKRIS